MQDRQHNSDIAIIGLSCRFPGAATPDEYWNNLCQGIESVTFFSDQEILAAGVDPSLIANPNYVKAAPILRDVEMFDASFFGYSPKDAALMDPQHRLFLEVCWEAFENAGYDPANCPGKVGALATCGGVVTSYLLAKLHHADLPGQTASISHINNDKDFLSTRVSYKFNLTGPSFTIQSACSSSLLAVHQACQMLRHGECDMMIVGGSVVRIPQTEGYLAERRNVHSLDGHCRPFDSVGQGTIFGSGVGAVLLKPLQQAIADRDHIFAVIKGTGANNDGSAKSSYTAPSLGQQARAMTDALEAAGVDADSVGYVECHATGTIVGDPLEITALSLAFRKQTKRNQYCAVGSVKANIGHPEQAAGIAGLIKTALVLHHKKIPPSINYEIPNPAIDFASSPFYVNTKLREFPRTNTPRRAALNSLGIGGTNSFAVLEEAPSIAVTAKPSQTNAPCLATLSAKSAEALVAQVEQLLKWLNDNPDAPIGDVCYTTNISRSQFAFRFAAPARSVTELKKQLVTWLQTKTRTAPSFQRATAAPIAFMFSGQGAQYPRMAAQLYRKHSVFRTAMDRCHLLAQTHLQDGLLKVIFAADGPDALVNRTDYTQPALFAVEYALTELVKSWGVSPDAVIGHSLGEFVAACVAGVMTLEDAMRLVVARGRLMHKMPGGGSMAAIFASESVVRTLIDKAAPKLAVAATNGPLNTVVSGDRDALRMLLDELNQRHITYRELQVSNAFHSARTEPILDALQDIAGEIKYQPPEVPLISNVTGELMASAPDKVYWRRHLREAVRFGDGMRALAELGCRTFLEIGPHPALLPIAQACLGGRSKSTSWIAALNRRKSDADSIAEMLVGLYLAGQSLNWAAVHADASWHRVPLPTYPFQRRRYWIEDETIHTDRAPKAIEQIHPLVGARADFSSNETHYEGRYGVHRASFISDHKIAGTIVLPTTAELEAATAVGRMHFGTSRISFDNAMHHQAMPFANGDDRDVRVSLKPLTADRASFKLESKDAENPKVWRTHMTGTLRKSEVAPRSAFSTKQVRERCRQVVPVADFYGRLNKLGLEYGPGFQGVRELYLGQSEALTKVRLPDGLADTQYLMHPAFLDACLHAYPLLLDGGDTEDCDRHESYLPVALERFRCYQDGVDKAWVHTRLRSVDKDDTRVIDIQVYDDADRPVADLDGLSVRLLPLGKLQQPDSSPDDLFYRPVWLAKDKQPANRGMGRAPASWVIFSDTRGVGTALAGKLEAAGHHGHIVFRGDAFARQGARTWTANERQPQEFRQLLAEFAASESLPCDGLIYLWGLDAPLIDGLTLARLKSGSEMMCRGALAILHALSEARSTHPHGMRLWFVTANTQKTEAQDQHVDPVQAVLWGLGRTAAIEYPGIWGGLIDLQLNGDQIPDIGALASELLYPDGEAQIAISAANQRHVARFLRHPISKLAARLPPIRGDATYLVTGGLGMLGRSVAKWLISKGARHLVLTGRHASADALKELFSTKEIEGVSIEVVSNDISRDDDVRRLIQTISRKFPPLRGVVHSVGILDDGILAQLDWGRFTRVFEPKVYGSWLLHEHTRSCDLDFFILQSSVLSLLGSAGQANYSASNSFVDSLAAHRRVAGLPGTAINWSAWSGGGLATASGARGEEMWSSLGIKFVSPERAMECFDSLMQRAPDQIAVAIADWPAYARKVGNPTFLAELLDGKEALGSVKPIRTNREPAAAVDRGYARTHEELSSRLQQRIMAELGFVDPIDPDRPLNEVGLDSLRSVTLANNLEDEFGVLISISRLISGPTINQLVEHLSGLLAGIEKAETVSVPTAITLRNGQAPIANNDCAQDQEADDAADDRSVHRINPVFGMNEKMSRDDASTNEARAQGFTPAARQSRIAASSGPGKWLIAPRPNPEAKVRLFCFPYAGGGLVSFRAWAKLFANAVEVVAVEPPGRGTRINETAVDDLDTFVESLLPEMARWLDRPSAFFGHCLGGLTMVATLHALPAACAHFVKHAFACGVRPPHLLKRRGAFEDNLAYDMMLHREFDARLPPFAQTDDIFADIIRQFDTPAANRMLEIPKLREVLLPTIRAEFRMAYNYKHEPADPFSFPISSFVGDSDPWVSVEDSAGWGTLTRGGFTNHVCKGSHFLMAEDGKYILETINKEFVNSAVQ
ncbi:MAG TPA: SDR family NAD(P)-dependent oxidoreductase [Pseudolabrys sp.]|nr:SDR family NAD(P)-dependent oxidoreductase [Pseudolabrys sp.]